MCLVYNGVMIDVLSKLFGSAARVKVLRLFLANKIQKFDIEEVAKRAKVQKAAVRKELNALSKIDLLSTSGTGQNKKWSVNESFTYLRALENLVLESGESDAGFIAEKLKKAGDVKLVAITGVFVPEAPASAVDLLVVGRLSKRKIDSAVAEIEANFGRELNFALFSVDDFNYRMDIHDRLLRDIFDYPHEIIVDKLN